jgi:hypothetical protein
VTGNAGVVFCLGSFHRQNQGSMLSVFLGNHFNKQLTLGGMGALCYTACPEFIVNAGAVEDEKLGTGAL